MNVDPAMLERVKSHVDRRRLLETAQALIEVPSPTGSAGAVSDRLAQLLAADGFEVDRPAGGYPAAPAVAVRLESGRPGRRSSSTATSTRSICRSLPPAIEDGLLTGSGASDMKGGIAAAVEALRAIRDSGCLKAGSVLLTAHDLHEAPWGDGRQLERAHSRRHPRRCRAACPSRFATCCRSPAEARRPGRSSSAARGRRFTRSCARATSRA